MAFHSRSTSAPVALSIAGSDSGANAGIQADLLTFAANRVFGTTAITCLTAQNPEGITKVESLDATFVIEQIRQVIEYYPVKAIKTGMLHNSEIVNSVARYLGEKLGKEDSSYREAYTTREKQRSRRSYLVVDPVMIASSGDKLLEDEAIRDYQNTLLPLADLITPNLDEAQVLLNRKLDSIEDIKSGATELAKHFDAYVLVKGGHMPGNLLFDLLAGPDGSLEVFEQIRILDIDTHGSGCTLSSACAAQLALGKTIPEAVSAARAYLRRGMESPIRTLKAYFINHVV